MKDIVDSIVLALDAVAVCITEIKSQIDGIIARLDALERAFPNINQNTALTQHSIGAVSDSTVDCRPPVQLTLFDTVAPPSTSYTKLPTEL